MKKQREKLPHGRPSKYDPSMDEIVIEGGNRGLSKEAIAGLIGIDHQTLKDWCNPESPRFKKSFSIAVTASQVLARLYLEDTIVKGIKKPDGTVNSQIASLIMRNRFGWDQKQTIEHEGSINHTFKWMDDDDDEA